MPEIVMPLGATSPPIDQYLTEITGVVDLTSSDVRFLMRPYDDDSPVLDSSGILLDAPTAHVQYQWSSGETDTEGQYFGWWKITLQTGQVFQSQEFPIKVDSHKPGLGADIGEIA